MNSISEIVSGRSSIQIHLLPCRLFSGESSCFKIVKMIMERNYAPVITFSFSKRDCESYATQLAKLDFNTGDWCSSFLVNTLALNEYSAKVNVIMTCHCMEILAVRSAYSKPGYDVCPVCLEILKTSRLAYTTKDLSCSVYGRLSKTTGPMPSQWSSSLSSECTG